MATAWATRTFGSNKKYRAQGLFQHKGETNKKARFVRKHGALARITPEKGWYRLWIHGSV